MTRATSANRGWDDVAHAGPTRQAPPFVGRETQLGALKSAVDAAELGESVLVLVAGEPGIGKTRLVAELASQVAVRTVWATCWEGDGSPAYWAWRQVVRAVGDGNEQALAEAIIRLEDPGPPNPVPIRGFSCSMRSLTGWPSPPPPDH